LTQQLRRMVLLVCVLMGSIVYGYTQLKLSHRPHSSSTQEMLVSLPVVVQVLASGGDRFLAANVDVWRSLVVSTERMHPDNFRVQGQLQVDASWLNPRSEDNYWVAAAILPWNGQVGPAQTVLHRASLARKDDWQPQFYYAFGLYYFERQPAAAAAWLLNAAPNLPIEADKYMLETIAAHWYERRFDPEVAVRYLEEMAKTSRSSGFRQHLKMRADRMRALAELRQAAKHFSELKGRPLERLDELVASGVIKKIPADPFGEGFDLDRQGVPVVK
jgi:hypothetical protein